MWKKVKKGSSGGTKKTVPSVYRARANTRLAYLALPGGFITGNRADIYSDGNRLAFLPSPTGSYVVRSGGRGRQDLIAIPSPFYKLIPFGTTDVELDRDGEMLVLDLDQPALAGATAHAAE